MMKKKSLLYRGLASICLVILVAFSITATVARAWAGKVDELLGRANTIQRSQDPADYNYQSDYENPADLIQAEIDLNTRIEAEGAVSLKGIPAIEGSKVTLFGMRSGEKMQFGGSMGALIEASQTVTLADAMTANGFTVNEQVTAFIQSMQGNYAPVKAAGGNVTSENVGTEIKEIPAAEYAAVEGSFAEYADAAVIVLGRDGGESCCFYPGEDGILNADEFSQSKTGNILGLSNDERDLIQYVESQGFGKVIVLLNSAVPMEIQELVEDEAVDSIIWMGNPGAYGTYGIAKLLSGDVLPSGHLPDTYAVNSALSPAAQNYGTYIFSNAEEIETTDNHALRSDWYLVENESIYIGYKYYETRYMDALLGQGNASAAKKGQAVGNSNTWDYDKEVSFSFGFGLEGSEFTEEIENINVDWTGATKSTVDVKVTNVGDAAAKHAVQLYLSQPYTDYDIDHAIEKAGVQLVGYAKTGEAKEASFRDVVLLAPGESETVTITFDAKDVISWDSDYAHDGVNGAYHLEAGDYYFATGNGAHDAAQAVLLAQNAGLADQLTSGGDCEVVTVAEDQAITELNDTLVQNQLASADLNNYGADVTVTYLTRSNWCDTFPQEISSLTATPEMVTLLRNQTYDAAAELAAYQGPTSFVQGQDNGVSAVELRGLPYEDPLYETVIDEIPMQTLVNQYIMYLGDIPEIKIPKEQRMDSPLGLIGKIGQYSAGSIYEVSEDQEGYGVYTNVYTSSEVVAATFSPLLAQEQGCMIGNDSLWTGYHAWFGPGLNIHRSPYNGRNLEYYSEDAVLTGNTSAYVHQGVNKYGLVTNAKHFAFNDQETNRDGVAVFMTEQAARENELRGFGISFRDGDMKGVMTAFNRIGCTHVAADRNLMNGILRGEWGFKGQIITDSVKSSAYFQPRECIMAGNNEMLGGSNNGTVWNLTAETVEKDPVLWSMMRDSYHHKLYTYVNSNLMNGITADTDVSGSVATWAVMLYVLMGLGFVGFVVFAFLYIRNERKEGGK